MIGRTGTAGETAQKPVMAVTRFENATARQVQDLKYTYVIYIFDRMISIFLESGVRHNRFFTLKSSGTIIHCSIHLIYEWDN